jgi:hypothetical protein
MIAEQALLWLLRTQATVALLVGSRIFDGYLPQDVIFPAVTYKRTHTPPIKDLAAGARIYSPHYQIDVYSLVSSDVRTIAGAIAALAGKPPNGSGMDLRWIWIEDVYDTPNQPQQMDERPVRQVTIELTLWYGA